MKLGMGFPIADTVPGEAFAHHLATFIEAFKLVGGGNFFTAFPQDIRPHDAGRVTIVECCIQAGCDRLFMMDDDTITPMGGITKLMAEMDVRKCAAISGFYVRRGYPYTPVWSKKHEDGNWFNIDASQGVHEIDSSGLGCCLIDLTWIKENLKKPWFKMDQIEDRTIISDDAVFFRGIKECGGKLLGDADIQCVHIGRPEFICRETAHTLRDYGDKVKGIGLSRRGDVPSTVEKTLA